MIKSKRPILGDGFFVQTAGKGGIRHDQGVFVSVGVVLGKRIHPGDIGCLHAVQHHVHGTDAQHGLVGIKSGEHGGGVVLLVFGFHQLGFVMLGDVLGCGGDEAGGTHGGVADGIFQSGTHQFDHHSDDVSGSTELTIGTALRNLGKQIFVDVPHDIFVIQIQAVQCIYHFDQYTGGGNLEQRILHIAGNTINPVISFKDVDFTLRSTSVGSVCGLDITASEEHSMKIKFTVLIHLAQKNVRPVFVYEKEGK